MSEKENCRRLIISGQRASVTLGLELNKKHNFFPQLRRWYMRSHNYLTIETSKERADKINAVISYELRGKVELASYKLDNKSKLNTLFKPAKWAMMNRLTAQSEEFRNYGEIIDGKLFSDLAGGVHLKYNIPPHRMKYKVIRKKEGYCNKPISPIFKNDNNGTQVSQTING